MLLLSVVAIVVVAGGELPIENDSADCGVEEFEVGVEVKRGIIADLFGGVDFGDLGFHSFLCAAQRKVAVLAHLLTNNNKSYLVI